jgi:hypothetical protein
MKKILSIGSIAVVFILVCSSFPTINASEKLDFKINQIEDIKKLNINKLKEMLENNENIDIDKLLGNLGPSQSKEWFPGMFILIYYLAFANFIVDMLKGDWKPGLFIYYSLIAFYISLYTILN